ncbi:hypothetical protein PVAND_004898 [Polypedilum vanderplanki]|uniref:Uncharacterized protein n=1 Tax=Polypedilum vanderplanki TaxID=319348 RepID=A0A9J6BYX7_POLVA|nr:hypothetical protein PVAND_004898 [Polypedilum vanderplanki]
MKPYTAATIFLTSVLFSLLLILVIAIFINNKETNGDYHLDETSILDIFYWILKLPHFQRYTIFVVIFFIMLFIAIDTIFVLWFMFNVQIAEKPFEFIQSSYKSMGKVDDIENLKSFEDNSIYKDQNNIHKFRSSSISDIQRSKCRSLSIPSVYFSQETPLRNSLQNSLASVKIYTKPNIDDITDDSSSDISTVKDFLFDGKPIEFKMFHGKEMLI